MKLTILAFLSALFISATVDAELDGNCQVKNKYNGKCLFLKDCKFYFDMVQNYQFLRLKLEEVFKSLKEVNCGYVRANPLVCCPKPDAVGVNQGGILHQNESVSNNSGFLSPSKNPGSSVVPNNSPMPPTKSPVDPLNIPSKGPPQIITSTKALPPTVTSMTAPTTVSTPHFSYANQFTKQSYKNENSIETTTSVVPLTAAKDSTAVINNEKSKILPEECGRILTFKYFQGNRTEFDDFPWTALIEYETPTGKKIGCGASLIHGRYVMTAAHCVTDLPPSWKVSRVRFGEYDTDTNIDCLPDGPNVTRCNDQPVNVSIEEVIAYPGFISSDPSRLHDIALLKLSVSVNFTSVVRPICLPTKSSFQQKYYTSGWGKDLVDGSIRNGTHLKYMSYVNLADQATCQRVFAEKRIRIGQICGGDSDQKPCIGDAGGPLMGLEVMPNLEKRIVAFAILSLNKPATGKCLSGYASAYTKVLDYMDWILVNLKK